MAEDIRTNTILNGRYQIQQKLGQGGMGAVYLAQDLRNRRPVAIKVARLAGPNDRAQFRREAGYLQKLHHHGLPRVWDIFSDTQQDYLVMEYIPGEDLESLVQARGPQPEWLVLRWAEELLDSLEYLHGQNPPVIHRDIKPGNLKLRTDETLVLVDFGIAKEFVPGMDTFAGATAVTPGYSPLEQYSGANTDARSDLYAVGATMYFLLSGRAPAAAPDRATGDARLISLLDVAPKTSPATDMLVRRAMSVSRDQRWPNAAAMRHAVDAAALQLNAKPGGTATTTPVATTSQSVERPAKPAAARRGGRVGLLALAIVAVVAVALFLTRGNRPPDSPATPSATVVASGSGETGAASGAPASAPTSTRVPASPTLTTPSPTNTPTATDTATPNQQPAAEGGVPPTSTPLATFTPRPSPTPPAPTKAPTATPAGASTSAVPPTVASAITVALESPNNGDSSSSALTFEWNITSGGLAPNQAFEWRLWKAGQDPVRDGLGLAGTTRSTRQVVNLPAADAAGQIQPDTHLWGVLLVETTPSYRPLRLISDTRTFRYDRTSGGQPEATLPPRP